MSVRVVKTDMNGGIDTFARVQEQNIKNAKRRICDSILNKAMMSAPVDTGRLRDNGRVVEESSSRSAVVFGDNNVPYARRRHFENKKNPQTLHYLSKAGEVVAKEDPGKWL